MIHDSGLDGVVQAWNAYVGERPRMIQPSDLLTKRDLLMYRGLGVRTDADLADAMVEHRSIATVEMSMGWLYERVLELLGPKKVTVQERKKDGFKGIDFIQSSGTGQITLVNLKAGLSTANSDVSESTARHLTSAKRYWERHYDSTIDDNPLGQPASGRLSVVMIRAVARGAPKHEVTDSGILSLVGASLWQYFGAEPDFPSRISSALGRTPLSTGIVRQEKELASRRVVEYIRRAGLSDSKGLLNWDAISAQFP